MIKRRMICEMPDNSRWAVPMNVIEESIKKELKVSDEDIDSYDDFDFIDWAQNNMNWEDVKPFAERVLSPTCDYQDGWCNGNKEIQQYEDAPQNTKEAVENIA